MQLSTLAVLAASVAPALAGVGEGPDWATYTKNLPKTTVTVTRYLGTSTFLPGPAFTTRTVVVSANGTPLYTEIITGINAAYTATATDVAAPAQTAAAEEASTEEEESKAAETTEEKTTEEKTTESSSESTEKSASVSSSSGFAAVGYVLGAGAIVAGAVFFLKKPKDLVRLPQ